MADSDAANRLVEPDKDINNVNVADDDSKANTNLKEEEVSSGDIEQSSNESKTEDQPDEDDLKDEMSTCTDNIHDEEEEEEEVKEMNYDKETMEELISKLHINGHQLPTIGKQGSSSLNNLRCRGRSALLLFYRLWRNHLVKKPPPPL